MKRKVFIDQLGDVVSIPFPPGRIVSLVPSQTELLFDLGLEREVVGITKFCVHPEDWMRKKQIIGGTKNFWLDVMDQLQPDLIIGNKEENYEAGIAQLRSRYPVWMSDVASYEDALNLIKSISEITDREQEGIALATDIQLAFDSLQTFHHLRALYLIWNNPWMGVGNHTFIHAMIGKAGFTNVLEKSDRYPELSVQDIQHLDPQIVFLSSEPFPFKEEHVLEMKKIVPKATIKLVDGEMFSWYGSRLKQAPDYFRNLSLTLS